MPTEHHGATTHRTATTRTASHTATPPEAPPEDSGRWGPLGLLPQLPSLPHLDLDALTPSKAPGVLEDLLRRDEADVILLAGNVVLVALEVIEWPVAALTMAVHLLARSRFKGLEALAETAEETD